jgi:PEP-CTERM motif-containing protein
MKFTFRPARAALLIFAMGLQLSAGSITTLFNTDNSGGPDDSQMFDITVLNAAGITITSVDVNSASDQSSGVVFALDVYTTPTTSVGKYSTPGAWTLVSTGSGTTGTTNTPSLVPVTSFFLAAGTYGIAFVAPTVNLGYTDATGTEVYSNADVSLDNFVSTVFAPFNGITNQRIWNGTINYSVGSAVTPEPGSFLMLGAGLLGLAAARARFGAR